MPHAAPKCTSELQSVEQEVAASPAMSTPELFEMKVANLHSSKLIAVEVTDTLLDAAEKMARNHVGALAVLDEGVLVGVVSEADLVCAMAEEAIPASTSVDEYMTEGPITVDPDDDVALAARRIVEHGIGHLLVMSGESAIGMVSKGDLLAIGAVASPR